MGYIGQPLVLTHSEILQAGIPVLGMRSLFHALSPLPLVATPEVRMVSKFSLTVHRFYCLLPAQVSFGAQSLF